MRCSYVILTYNRRDRLLGTLDQIHRHPRTPGNNTEIWVVDNGSTDGTDEAVKTTFPKVRLIRRQTNEGVWARQYAVDQATGQYICFLDDDSFPTNDAVNQSIRFLDENPTAGGVTGSILLPNGAHEASALPVIPAIGGWCARCAALEETGGLAPCRSFFRQAEEYDVAFRLLDAGYTLHRFENVVYRHQKPPGARSTALTHRLDMRNNLIVLHRYVPRALRRIYARDWTSRYAALAKHHGFGSAARTGWWQGQGWCVAEKLRHRQPSGPNTIESVFGLAHQAQTVSAWSARHQIRRVVIADLSKNIYATYRACLQAGLQIQAVADNHAAFARLRYRRLSIEPDAAALRRTTDGIVLSNVNPAQVHRRLTELQEATDLPVLALWRGQVLTTRSAPEPGATVNETGFSQAATAASPINPRPGVVVAAANRQAKQDTQAP